MLDVESRHIGTLLFQLVWAEQVSAACLWATLERMAREALPWKEQKMAEAQEPRDGQTPCSVGLYTHLLSSLENFCTV